MQLRHVAFLGLLTAAAGCREADASEGPPMVAQRQRPIPRIVASAPADDPPVAKPVTAPVAPPRSDLGPPVLVGPRRADADAPVVSSGRFSLAPQLAGRPVDGVILRSIRHAAHRGFHRVVFDFAPGERTAAAVAPLARAELVREARAVQISLAGVAVDLAAGSSVAEGGARRARTVWIGRAPAHVDAAVDAVAYRVSLPRVHGFSLRALEDPPRIVLDVDD